MRGFFQRLLFLTGEHFDNLFSFTHRRLKSRPFVCLWDWKRSARGLTLISSTPLEKRLSIKSTAYLSLLHLGNDNINGLSAVHILEKVWNGVRQLRKIVFNLGTLSPPYVESSLGVDQPSAIILQHDSITFPAFGKVSQLCFVPTQFFGASKHFFTSTVKYNRYNNSMGGISDTAFLHFNQWPLSVGSYWQRLREINCSGFFSGNMHS